ncbi:hypothetical protein BN903_62 [Halorubrum sp. AJ67]|nr:hypothetical protein BN903_62 [Halorubrum sp. AJ67]
MGLGGIDDDTDTTNCGSNDATGLPPTATSTMTESRTDERERTARPAETSNSEPMAQPTTTGPVDAGDSNQQSRRRETRERGGGVD